MALLARYLRKVKSDKDACTILQERFSTWAVHCEVHLHTRGAVVYGS